MNDIIHHLCCPLCHSTEMTFFITATDCLVSGCQFDIVQCAACGFLFTQDAPECDKIGQYYMSENYQPHTSGHGLSSIAYRSARAVMFRWKNRLIRHYHQPRGVLLDVGAGSGHFLAYMQSQGWSVLGCEQSELARTEAWRRCGLQLDGNVMDTDYPPGCADVITAWHAIEHIHDLHGVWSRFYRWLKPDGLLVVAVPNCDSLDARHYGCEWAAWDVPRHLWHFSAETITMLAQQHRCELIDIRAMPLDAFYMALLSDRSRFKALANGLGFTFQSAIRPWQASSLVFLFRKLL